MRKPTPAAVELAGKILAHGLSYPTPENIKIISKVIDRNWPVPGLNAEIKKLKSKIASLETAAAMDRNWNQV